MQITHELRITSCLNHKAFLFDPFEPENWELEVYCLKPSRYAEAMAYSVRWSAQTDVAKAWVWVSSICERYETALDISPLTARFATF